MKKENLYYFYGDMTFLGADCTPLTEGIRLLSDTLGIVEDPAGYPVRAVRSDTACLAVEADDNGAVITYGAKSHFFRALGLLIEKRQSGETVFSLTEQPAFSTCGVMLDVCQGNQCPKDLRPLFRKMALMGLNMFMLYCEDAMEIPEEPYYGYMRSRYSEQELRDWDDYAEALGIEIIPCVQTLAHLTNVLRWFPYKNCKESSACLLPGEERTYQLIEHLIRAASRPFRSRRIHIGMDEAVGLGRGPYETKHGPVPVYDIMKGHLDRVMEIVRAAGLAPMMWSDMFFCCSGTGAYGSSDQVLPEEVLSCVPKDVSLVFWDYYRTDAEKLRKLFVQHRRFSSPTVFAGGSWSWLGYGFHWLHTRRATETALGVCREFGITDVFCTTWGDDETEAPLLINLPAFQLYGELCYHETVEEEDLARRFRFCTGGELADFTLAEAFDKIPGVSTEAVEAQNPVTALVWQDILTGLADTMFEGLPLEAHFRALAEKYEAICQRYVGTEYESMFRMYHALARFLVYKSTVGLSLTAAYRASDREALLALAKDVLPQVKACAVALHTAHRAFWSDFCKPLGFDVFDRRYGALEARIDTALLTLNAYLDGRIDRIEELEVERLPIYETPGIPRYIWHRNISSPTYNQ